MTSKMKFKSNMMRVLKHNATPIFLLLSLTIASRLLLITNAPFIYHFDSYTYLSKAIKFSSNGEIKFEVGMPFVIFLGVFLYILGATFGAITVSRLLMLLMSALLVYLIYLFGLRMAGKIFAFIAALIAIFEPFSLSYSTVPHNDIFVVAVGLAALYLATSQDMKFRYVLSFILFYIAIFTRPEFLVALVFPLLIFSFLKHLKVVSFRNIIKFVFFSSLFFLPVVWVNIVYPTVTRFGVIEKFSLFLQPELLKLTLESLFKFYDQAVLNQIFFALVGLGVGFAFLNFLGKFVAFEKKGKEFSVKRKKDKSVREVFLSNGVLVGFCLFLLFFIQILILTVYGYGYTIVDGALIIKTWLPERYLILPRLLLSFPLAYILSMVVREVYVKVVRKE